MIQALRSALWHLSGFIFVCIMVLGAILVVLGSLPLNLFAVIFREEFTSDD